MKTIPAGTAHEEVISPEAEHLASAMGNHGVDVVATTALILFFESACHNLASPFYEPTEISVGTHVNIDHLAPAFGNKSVRVVSRLSFQQGRRLEFHCEAWQEDTLVMSGEHHRAVMDRSRFSEPAKDSLSATEIEFWFDFHSPWCYFASHRIGEIAREFNANLIWKPVHLANLNLAVDGRRPLEANDNFVAWYLQDLKDTAAMMGLPIDQHKNYPCRPSRALRASIYASEQGLAEPFVRRVMRSYWSEQKDISDADWLLEVAVEVGLDLDGIRDAMKSPEYKRRLNANLETAVAKKLFGLPVAMFNGKVFWGNDRLDLLRHHMSGRSPLLA